MINQLARYYSIIESQDKKLRFIMSRLLWRSRLCYLAMIYRNGYKMRFFPTALAATLWVENNDRNNDELFLEHFLKRGDTFVDIGANIGVLTLKAASVVGESGSVIAFEPHPRVFNYLTKNISLNDFRNIRAYNVGLGEHNNILHFTNKRSDDQNKVSEIGSIKVNVEPLDHYKLRSVDLMKVDVEGYEKFVFLGGSNTLDGTHTIYFESWDKHCQTFGYHAHDLIKMLVEMGFRIFKLTAEHQLYPVPDNYNSKVCENLIATKNVPDLIRRTQYQLLANSSL